MDFIKRMKKREFIEMSLKAVIAFFASFLVIILMEGMIYGIQLHALETYAKVTNINSEESIGYCIERGKDQYFVVIYTPKSEFTTSEDNTTEWFAHAEKFRTKAECEQLRTSLKEMYYRAPTAFEFSITPVHFAVMAVFELAVVGFFVYKFILLGKEYKKIEEKCRTTGVIEIKNL